jgi:hypothetical protein
MMAAPVVRMPLLARRYQVGAAHQAVAGGALTALHSGQLAFVRGDAGGELGQAPPACLAGGPKPRPELHQRLFRQGLRRLATDPAMRNPSTTASVAGHRDTQNTRRDHPLAECWLPAPMIPRVYVWLDEMPLNRAGKIDRRALAKMLDPALSHPDAIRNPHVVPFTCGGGTATGSCPDAC